MSVSLSTANPLDALLLPVVLRWVAVVFRQKSKCGHLDAADGRPWTRLPARDLAAQLEREHGLEVGVRRVQRSLERLVESGHLARQQRTKWWGQRDYWYSWSDVEWALQQHRPTAVSRGVSSQRVSNRRSEATVPSRQVLSTPLSTQTSLKPEQQTASRFNGGSTCATPQVGSTASSAQPVRSAGKGTSQGHLGTSNSLQQVVQRATARGFGAKQPESESWVEGSNRFTRLANGRVVCDPLTTAPLR